tara:strand:+ start:406 stop:972 length:567 start_codon:yes stop_codon:yes gene_type:complete
MNKIGKWLSGKTKEPVISAIQEDNDVIVSDEWYQYYRECARKLRLVLRIMDHTGIARNDSLMDTVIGEAHRDMRKLADILDPEEKKEWLSRRIIKGDTPIPESKRGKFASGIGAYKWQCIEKMKSLRVGESLCVEDRTHETVGYWIKYLKRMSSPETLHYRRARPEFSGKRFIVEEIDHNRQNIRRIK